ncbi:hypothetical protein [Muricoccus radiodurans]|uniref:hypothetical protein n=1 Tax=Muricoccus radiodurans TaxID=2231721 RepID=UPI003CE7D340
MADDPERPDAEEPPEAFKAPKNGLVDAWVRRWQREPPSSGVMGRAELLQHWDKLPRGKRHELLLIAREMVDRSQGG